jgi:hypothetical protein
MFRRYFANGLCTLQTLRALQPISACWMSLAGPGSSLDILPLW